MSRHAALVLAGLSPDQQLDVYLLLCERGYERYTNEILWAERQVELTCRAQTQRGTRCGTYSTVSGTGLCKQHWKMREAGKPLHMYEPDDWSGDEWVAEKVEQVRVQVMGA